MFPELAILDNLSCKSDKERMKIWSTANYSYERFELIVE